jgi:hypothetical protein
LPLSGRDVSELKNASGTAAILNESDQTWDGIVPMAHVAAVAFHDGSSQISICT